jgi:cell wall-associated NlpC family hydrolase
MVSAGKAAAAPVKLASAGVDAAGEKTSVNGAALGSIAIGLVFLYSGIKGYSVTQSIQNIIKGTTPAVQVVANPIISLPGAGPTGIPAGATPTGAAVATDALQYKGAGWVWGGAPAKGIGIWDCSSFSNWVIGHDMGMAIPGYQGGTYTGASHGPTTLIWLAWTGCTTISHNAADAAPGDLCCWQTHMGIAIGGGQMISAQDAYSGTQISGIGMPGELLFVRRLKATIATGPPAKTPGGP